MDIISSWDRITRAPHNTYAIYWQNHLHEYLNATKLPLIPYGAGKSYGDVCLNPHGSLWKMTNLNRFLEFNESTGVLRCEAGVLLKDINNYLIPQGWKLPVVPGTQYVTVGGAIANDIHGKNHHCKGSFGHYVKAIKLLRTDGEILSLNRADPFFAATIGGLGLTGIIISADLQLEPTDSQWFNNEIIPFSNIEEFTQLSNTNEYEYTVAWLDCAKSRGLFMRANFIKNYTKPQSKKNKINIPGVFPISLVNHNFIRVYNSLYFGRKKNTKETAFYEDFFFPLDNIINWNKLYGRKGFFQYQCVIPYNTAVAAIKEILKVIARQQMATLAVIKSFGYKASVGMLSFPMPGITLAVDFNNQGTKTLELFNTLDKIVCASGGRLYAAKDTRMSAAVFAAGYEKLHDFLQYRDPGISSSFSKRVTGI